MLRPQSGRLKTDNILKLLQIILDNILLVGISYDKKQKTHNCVIEKYSEK